VGTQVPGVGTDQRGDLQVGPGCEGETPLVGTCRRGPQAAGSWVAWGLKGARWGRSLTEVALGWAWWGGRQGQRTEAGGVQIGWSLAEQVLEGRQSGQGHLVLQTWAAVVAGMAGVERTLSRQETDMLHQDQSGVVSGR
jgi:hypothetical protein